MKNIKDNKAITLIALVVTIIILLILGGVTIGFTMNGTGLFDKAKLATDEYNNKVEKENYELEKTTNEIGEYIGGNRDIQYVTPFIDPANVLETIANDSNWGSYTHSYTATQDCYILGFIHTYNGGAVNMNLNTVRIGFTGNWNTTTDIAVPVNYLIKAGDTIEFQSTGGSCVMNIAAYGIRN